MFGLMRNLYHWAKKKKEKRITLILIGLDGAGKTTLLSAIKGEIPGFISPTWGFNSETVISGKYILTVFDVGGGAKIRGIWPRYFAEVHGAVFVVDAADVNRVADARDALFDAIKDPRLNGKPILIFANKQDLPTAVNAAELSLKLGLPEVKASRFSIRPSIALRREGQEPDENVKLGLKWMVNSVDSDYKSLSERLSRQTAEQKEIERKEKEERRLRVEKAREERRRQEAEEESQKHQEGVSLSTVENRDSDLRPSPGVTNDLVPSASGAIPIPTSSPAALPRDQSRDHPEEVPRVSSPNRRSRSRDPIFPSEAPVPLSIAAPFTNSEDDPGCRFDLPGMAPASPVQTRHPVLPPANQTDPIEPTGSQPKPSALAASLEPSSARPPSGSNSNVDHRRPRPPPASSVASDLNPRHVVGRDIAPPSTHHGPPPLSLGMPSAVAVLSSLTPPGPQATTLPPIVNRPPPPIFSPVL